MLRMMGYHIKSFIRDREYIIWSIVFPLAYFTIYYFALGNLIDSDMTRFPEIPLGIVVQDQADEKMVEVFKSLDFVDVKETGEDLDTLKDAMREDRLKAIVFPVEKEDLRQWDFLLAYSDPYYATVLREVVQQMNAGPSLEKAISRGIQAGRLKMPDPSQAEGGSGQAFKGVKVLSPGKALEPFYQFFFAALAYISFFPIHVGQEAVSRVEGNQSSLAQRRLVGPKSKWLLFFMDIFPLIIFQLIIMTIAYLYSLFLGIDYGGYHLEILALLWLGVISAILFGTILGVLQSRHKGLGRGIAIALPLFFGFLSGMMGEAILGFVDKTPILSWIQSINPIGIVSKGLYILKLEGPTGRYFENLGQMALVCLVLLALTLFFVRRKKYENL